MPPTNKPDELMPAASLVASAAPLPSETFSTAVLVTLSVNPGDATLHFRTDLGEYLPYSSPLPLEGDTSLSFYAAHGDVRSEIQTLLYRVDIARPLLTTLAQ